MTVGNRVLKIDKSLASLALWRDKVLKNVSLDIVEGAVKAPSGEDLFGETQVPLFRLTENQHVKDTTEFLSPLSIDSFESMFGHGIVIECTVSGVVLKKMVAECERLGVKVVRSEQTPETIVNSLNLSPESRQFLLDYAGDDADLLIPIARTLGDVSKDFQRKVTVEDLIVRLPRPPGSIPPWDVTQAILTGNVTEAIETRRRFARTSNDLVWVVTTRKKIDTLRKVAILIENGLDDSKIQKSLGLQPKGFSFLKKDSRKLGSERLASLLDRIVSCEASLKGHGASPRDVTVEKAILEMCSII